LAYQKKRAWCREGERHESRHCCEKKKELRGWKREGGSQHETLRKRIGGEEVKETREGRERKRRRERREREKEKRENRKVGSRERRVCMYGCA
jgi:hypothetical protein